MKLAGKRAIITGASDSIGRAIAVDLAKEGAKVAISYNSDKDGAMETVRLCQIHNPEVKAIQANFADMSALETFAEEACHFLGGVDILVNNAGIFSRETWEALTAERMALVYQINTIAPFFLTQYCARKMSKGSAVVNISSIASLTTFSRGTAYAASKAALNKVTENTALELAPLGIRVNAIAPGVVATGMNADTEQQDPQRWQQYLQQIPLGRAGLPADIAALALFLISDGAAWMTGKVISMDGGHILA